ncbi:hypothetical protein GALL_284210 [mine drainage metagenome]|uniref:GGDEF domain-containing protein n=1 Tax=mine drainage metagenome TaxID=410659 RepID=A0A1J5R2K2_9ZZZZ
MSALAAEYVTRNPHSFRGLSVSGGARHAIPEVALNAHKSGQALPCIQGRFLHARFSAGVAAMEVGNTIAQSLEEADARLYEAKACASAAPGPACDDGPCDA